MINVVDDLLAEVLRKEFGKTFAPAEMPEIVFGHASTVEGKAPAVSLYLYDVRENTALRGDPFTVARRPDGKTATRIRSTLRFDLTYAVSGHGPDPRTEHALLTYALGAFLRNPSVEMPPHPDAPEGEDRQSMALAVAQPDHDAPPPLPVGRPTPSVTLRVTAPFNPFDLQTVPLVREAIFAYGQGTEPGFLGHPVDTHALRLSATGEVTSNGRPLQNVLVSVVDRFTRTTTDEEGVYLLLNLPPGRHEILFERRGYAPVRRVVEAPATGRVHELKATDVELEPLEHEAAIEAAKNLPALDFSHLLQTDFVQRASVVGRLRYPDGAPAAFLPVRRGDQTTVTDSQGVYALGLAPFGSPLIAEIPGHGPIEVRDETAPRPPQKGEKDPGSGSEGDEPTAPRRPARKNP